MDITEEIKAIARKEAEEVLQDKLTGAISDILKMYEKPEFITFAEASHRYPISVGSLHNYCNQGVLTRHRIAGKVLLSISQIEAVLASGQKYKR